ncbi:MAG: thiamine phosphate synthase [Desulforhopalus sp.]|jgi:thiamine-phosphate pyrophosphorylase|nr:thiamine phosphate synthase [Desulforhopalus sp.]
MTGKKEVREVLPAGLYGITAEKFSGGRTNIQVVEEMIKGGIKIIQYREKRASRSYNIILEECKQIRTLTRAAGVTFIVNDYVDVALLVDADGVHVGQDDLPVGEVRRLLGRDKIVGLSTHSPQQAEDAVVAGADYLGVGPIFATKTKDDVCDPVGFSYLEWVVENISLPFVAIGGIKQHNIDQIAQRGAKTICLVTEIVGASDIVARVHELHTTLAASRTA